VITTRAFDWTLFGGDGLAASLLFVLVAVLAAYVLFVLALVLAGRRTDARAWAGFVPDCIVLTRRLIGDERVPRSAKLLLGALVLYLAFPLDLVPDFLPVIGALDDAILVALVLRRLLRVAGQDVIRERWPGPDTSLQAVLRLAGVAA
jgi:uncharacterized membrane protein YkvA (DUF1232 family)